MHNDTTQAGKVQLATLLLGLSVLILKAVKGCHLAVQHVIICKNIHANETNTAS